MQTFNHRPANGRSSHSGRKLQVGHPELAPSLLRPFIHHALHTTDFCRIRLLRPPSAPAAIWVLYGRYSPKSGCKVTTFLPNNIIFLLFFCILPLFLRKNTQYLRLFNIKIYK